MLAYAKYPVSAVKIQCVKRQNEIIESFRDVKGNIDSAGDTFTSITQKNTINELRTDLIALNELLNMCSTLKTYGETLEKYITLDLEYVNLLWPNI